jgi:putative FmdB family regulatory protein
VRVATYEYRCGTCGGFDVRFTLGTAADQSPCPSCGIPARRAFSSPSLVATGPASLNMLRGLDERSQDAPDVVTEVPAKAREVAPAHPALARLPRP